MLRGSKRDLDKKSAILMRSVDPARREHGAVEFLVELTRRQGDEGVPLSLTLTAYRSGRKWKVWMSKQPALCLRSVL